MEFAISLVRGFCYFSDGGVPEHSISLDLWVDSIGRDEGVKERTSEGMVFEYFGVFSLIFWYAYEQPVDPVGGDTVLGVCCSVVEVVSEIFDCAFVVIETFAFTQYGLIRVSDIEVYRAAVPLVVPFANVVQANGIADGPDEVLADKLFGILFEVLFTDLVFLSEENGFNLGGGAEVEFVAEGFN